MEHIIVTCYCHNSCCLPYVRSLAFLISEFLIVQQDSASAHKTQETFNLLQRETPAFISPDLWSWSTASSISDCSKPCHTCSRRCRSSSMSWTLVSCTRCWMTDHSARHVVTELIRPQSGGLCHLFCHSAWCSGYILRVHYKSMKCGVSFSLGIVSALFR